MTKKCLKDVFAEEMAMAQNWRRSITTNHNPTNSLKATVIQEPITYGKGTVTAVRAWFTAVNFLLSVGSAAGPHL